MSNPDVVVKAAGGNNLQKKTAGLRKRSIIDNFEMLTMCLPTLLHIFVFCYLPMFGVILAFKYYRVDQGIWGSKWVGLKNLSFFFTSQDAWRVTRNTIGLNLLFIVIGTICAVLFALMIFEIRQKFAVKTYQTVAILPSFLSWVAVGYMTYALLEYNKGIINQLINLLGGERVQWYFVPELWPFILLIVYIWKTVGLSSVIYFAALIGIDKEYCEAAIIDGASKAQLRRHIYIPLITPVITILTILNIGGIIRSDFGMFFNITRNIGVLYPTTDVIDTYVYRALTSVGDIGMSSAVGLFQSVVGFILICATNFIVNKIEPENSLF